MKSNLINGMKPEFGNLEQIKILQAEENKNREEKELADFYANMSPGARAFDAFVNVDWTMGFIKNMTEQITASFNGRSPIDIMIDKATGYDKGVLKWFLMQLKESYEHLIENFKVMGDEERENEFKGLLIKVKEALKGEYKKVKAVDFKLK